MIKSAVYIKSLTHPKDAPESKPAVLFLGRSNVGKSSFINSLTQRKNLARTSNTPGKTMALNFYLINDNFYIIDAPGYGYAKRSKNQKDEFIIMIENLLLGFPDLKMICLLIDFKIGPTKEDLETFDFLKSLGLELMIVATKKDKIPNTRQYKQEKMIKEALGGYHYFYAISNVTKLNINLIVDQLLLKLGVE